MGYDFIELENPNYMQDYETVIDTDLDYSSKYLLRKPTPKERREIIINTIIECNGRSFSVPKLAKLLAVSDRTLQNILRKLKSEGIIEITPRYGKNGVQKSNSYRYIGEPCDFYGNGLTLKMLYNAHENFGFRDWAWKEHVFNHDRSWHSIYPLCKEKFKSRIARRKYLEERNLPLIVPEEIKYLVLRYSYWKGETDKLYKSDEFICSKDGTVKIAIEPLNRTEAVPFFGYMLSVEISSIKDNPKITITNAETEETLGVFTWFEENIIQSDKQIDDTHTEQFFILGDFTTK